MANQKLSAFEKTAIQSRHAIKRLEVLVELSKSADEIVLALQMIEHFKAIRELVPAIELDVDIKEKE